MRILFLVAHPKFHTGGAEVQSYRIATEFSKLEHQIIFLMSSNVRREKDIDQQGFQINFFKRGQVIKLLGTFRAYRSLMSIKPDVILMRGIIYAWPAALYYGRTNRNVPVIWQVPSGRSLIKYSNLKELFQTRRILSIIKNFIYAFTKDSIQLYTIKNSKIIVSQTEINLEVLKRKYNRDSIKILKGIPLCTSEFKKSSSFPIKIYFIRNLKPRSRVHLFISVCDLILESRYNEFVEFNIIGENQGNINISKLIDGKDRIKYHGKLSNDQVLAHLDAAHILIDTLHEFQDLTTYSTTFIEAWSRKVVILSFDTNPDNVLEKRRIGFKVKSPKDCADKVISLIEDSVMLNKMAENSFEYARMNHDISDEVAILRKLAGI